MKRMVGISGMAVLCALALLLGCEEGTGTKALTVEPSFVDLGVGRATRRTTTQQTGTNATTTVVTEETSGGTSNLVLLTQTFTVTDGLRELSLPLKWRVSNPSLGTIAAAGGKSASYVSTGMSGENAVIVEDQYGAEGVATIRQ